MRFPLLRQHDASDCGPAAIAMIAAFYRKRISIAKLRELAGTDRQGTSMAGLLAASEQVGFKAKAVRATAEALTQIPLPAIAHWHEDGRAHFVVICKINRHSAHIADPARGKRKLTRAEFETHWSGALLLLAPTIKLRDAIATKSSFTRLCSLLLPHHHLFLDALLAAVLMTVLGLTSSFFIQALVDYVFVLGQKPSLNWLGLGMLLVLGARVGFLGLRTTLLAHLSQRIDADTVLGYHGHLLGLPLHFFSSRRTGEILSRMNDAVKIRIAVSATTLSVIVDTLLVAATGAIMLIMNWRATLASIGLLPVLGLIVWLLNAPMKRHQLAAMEKAAEIEAHMVETIGGIQTVKALRAESAFRIRAEARFAEMLDASLRSQMIAAHGATLTAFSCGLSGLSLLWLGGRQVLDGSMTVGELMALNAMLGMLMAPLDRLANANPAIQDAIAASERLGEVLETGLESDRERPGAIDRRMDGAVEFRKLSFRYNGRRPIFENLTLRIEPGECAGIAGESGCGKTTLVNLLGRFLEPTGGAISIDGIDLNDYTFACLRREIAVVPQDIVLFSGTIADNIRMGRPEANAAEISAAARTARVDRIVERLPGGFATVVGERGRTLSGGERQRVALARALLADPAILLLDEPTSQLDCESEVAVQALIDSRRRNRRTTIVISHRPLQLDRWIHLGRPDEINAETNAETDAEKAEPVLAAGGGRQCQPHFR